MSYPDETPCVSCGHPAGHHDAGECWTDRNGNEVRDNRDCDCPGFEAAPTPIRPPRAPHNPPKPANYHPYA